MNKVEHNFRRGDHIFPAFFFAVPIFLITFADAYKLIDILSGRAPLCSRLAMGFFIAVTAAGVRTRIFVGN